MEVVRLGMKKILLIFFVLIILPIAAFAEWGIGPAAFIKSPVLVGQPLDTDNLNVTQFSFGPDFRLKVIIFQAEALLLLSLGPVNSINGYLDVGLAVDIAIVRLSLGVGPNINFNLGPNSLVQAGFNAKAGIDFKLGPVSLGLSYIMALNVNNQIYVNTGSGLLGIQVLFWL